MAVIVAVKIVKITKPLTTQVVVAVVLAQAYLATLGELTELLVV